MQTLADKKYWVVIAGLVVAVLVAVVVFWGRTPGKSTGSSVSTKAVQPPAEKDRFSAKFVREADLAQQVKVSPRVVSGGSASPMIVKTIPSIPVIPKIIKPVAKPVAAPIKPFKKI